MPEACPTPSKSSFATCEAAESSARRVQIPVGFLLHPYQCPCGWWHLTKQRRANVEYALLMPQDYDRALLAKVDEAAFLDAVHRDVLSRTTETEALSLRHPLNLRRWQKALKTIWIDIEGQFSDRSTDKSQHAMEWRSRANHFKTAVALRREEVSKRIEKIHLDRGVQEATLRQSVEDASAKDKRRIAGDIAKDRLIDAHREEFLRLVAEECALLDVTPSKNVLKAVAAQPAA